MPISEQLLAAEENKFFELRGATTLRGALELVLEREDLDSWWFAVGHRYDGTRFAVRFEILAEWAARDPKLLDRSLGELEELPAAVAVERQEMATGQARREARRTPGRVLVVLEKGKLAGLVSAGFSRGAGSTVEQIRKILGRKKSAAEPQKPTKSTATSHRPLIYISFSEKDKSWKDRLLDHLNKYVAEGIFNVWHDDLQETEGTWPEKISNVRNQADAAILLISPDYLTSAHLTENEIPHLLDRMGSTGLFRLLPIVVETAQWSKFDWLSSISLYPQDGSSISQHSQKKQEQHLARFASEVASIFNEKGQDPDRESPSERTNFIRQSVPTHLDDPAYFDLLNRRPFAKVIASRIRDAWNLGFSRNYSKARGRPLRKQKEARAFSVHIHGPWGIGKTSILNLIREALQSEEPDASWLVVEFNAWRHQRIRPPWWSLIQEVYRGCLVGLGKSWWNTRKFKLRWRWFLWYLRADWLPILLAAAVILLIFWLIGGTWLGTGSQGSTGPPQSGWSKGFELALKIVTALLASWFSIVALGRSLLFGSSKAAQQYLEISRDPMRPIARLFEKLIGAVGRPVAIFIDDLDRCDADYVVELLEGIQTLLRRADVTYVVAADRAWIRASFEQRYEGFTETIAEPGRPLGYLFLEKLFQVSASVPLISPNMRREYWQSLIETTEARTSEEIEHAAREAEKEGEALLGDAQSPDELQSVIDQYEDEPAKQQGMRSAAAKRLSTPAAQEELEHFLQPFARLLEPNPRAMKRLVNAYGIHQAVSLLEGRDVDTRALALWTIIELRWPLLADLLTRKPQLVEKIGSAIDEGDKTIPEELRDLFTDRAVKAVCNGSKLEPPVTLDEEVIREIVGLSVAERTEAVR